MQASGSGGAAAWTIRVASSASCRYPYLVSGIPCYNDCARTTIETLLEAEFQPTRTVVLSFGFDEESSGFHVNLTFTLFASCSR